MNNQTRCDGVTRRNLIRVGGLSALGLQLGLGDLFRLQRAQSAENPIAPKAKSCILIWLDGGASHLETFDPKPDAPEEVRGPLGTIATSIPGIRINECLQHTAGVMEKVALVRSMTSPLGEHNFGTHYLMTGYKPSPALQYPTFGATLAQMRQNSNASSALPPNIAVPRFSGTVSGSGYLSNATAPFSVGGDPARADFKVRDLDFYRGLDLSRLDRRRQMIAAMDRFSQSKDAAASSNADPDLQRAYNLISSPTAKAAFNLSEEPSSVRKRYGQTGANSIGQSCLLARRLVQRNVPFVTVFSNGWDTHEKITTLKERYPNDRNAHLPALDRAVSALIGDLDERGMLDETLVIVMGEFGRTPKINSRGGRDHWPNVFSVALAGGGIKGGQVVGRSDALGEYPKDNPITPENLATTIYTLLGINPSHELLTPDGRPVRVAPDGARVVKELLA